MCPSAGAQRVKGGHRRFSTHLISVRHLDDKGREILCPNPTMGRPSPPIGPAEQKAEDGEAREMDTRADRDSGPTQAGEGK